MQCENCGKSLADNATFCTSCGWKTGNWHREAKRGKEKHAGLIIALTLALVMIIFLFVIILNLITY